MSEHRNTWRLINSPPAAGAWNMSVDESILESVTQGLSPTTLRLYSWQPPCLSLGYAQPFSDVDLNNLSALGWDMVRRPTGGRAILHTDELTYSVIGLQEDPNLSGTVLESYQRLSAALLKALEMLGLPARADPHPSIPQNNNSPRPICFEVPSTYEITVGGRKIIGSAQARKKGGVLQHGSLPLKGDLGRITAALALSEDERKNASLRIHSRAATVEEMLGYAPQWEEVAIAFQRAFEWTLNLELHPSHLSAWEENRAQELLRDKYGNQAWIAKLRPVR
jgi:lipoate-protein ligase A